MPMPIGDRAKQFMPFAAVKGLNEALQKKERIARFKSELTDDMAMVLNEKFHKLRKGTLVHITYFLKDDFVVLTGQITRIDNVYRTINIDDTEISIDAITRIDCTKNRSSDD
jgi:hypothetical protein